MRTRHIPRLFAAVVLVAALSSCGGCKKAEVPTCSGDLTGSATCAAAGEEQRPYDIFLPRTFDPGKPTPLLFMIHGGGGNREAAVKTACPAGNLDDPRCLYRLALDRGWVVVSPSGTSSRLVTRLRTWNAGGGTGDWQCVSGRACKEGVDDVAYFDKLLADLRRHMTIDDKRIFATGLSNGGAMSHRLACERGGVFAAIVPVGGGNQLETTAKCEPSQAVAVMQIHGTADPCWTVDGGPAACLQRDDKKKQGIDETVRNWAKRNGCVGEPIIEDVPDKVDDGTSTKKWRWEGCAAPVEYLRIEGGGHTYPGGDPYFAENVVGPVARDFGAEKIVEFLEENGR